MALRFVIRRIVIPAAVLIASSPVLTSALAQGGGGQQPRPSENLKYFPKDTAARLAPHDHARVHVRARRELRVLPRRRSRHAAGRETALRPALDDKVEKQTARFMLAMVDTLNRVTLAKVPQRHEAVQITCVTCHRGSPLPGTIETVLPMRWTSSASTRRSRGIESCARRRTTGATTSVSSR